MRRTLPLTLAFAVVLTGGLTACGGGGSGDGSGALRVTLANHVWTDTIKSNLAEFEKESGVKVEINQLGEDQLSDQYNVKLNAGTDEIDVMMYRPLQEGKQFAKNKYLAPVPDSLKSDEAWDFKDFQKGPIEAVTQNDKVTGVPIITEREVLYYRKDLLAKSGISVPTTMEEFEAAAKKLKADNPGVAGFVARTGKSTAVTQFSSYLFSFGGDFDKDGKATLDTEEAKKAYAFYGGLIKNAGPENVSTDMSWPEAMAIFTQGKAAMYTDADSLYKNATDAAKSKVAETVGFAPFPAGPAGSKPYNIPSWALGVNSATKNSDNAWKFIKWATSKTMVSAMQKAGNPGPRESVWASAEGVATYPKDLADAIKASSAGGVGHDRPLVVKVAKAREIVGQPIVDVITGQDAGETTKKAQDAYAAFLSEEK